MNLKFVFYNFFLSRIFNESRLQYKFPQGRGFYFAVLPKTNIIVLIVSSKYKL